MDARYAEVVVNTSLHRGRRATRHSEEARAHDAVEALGRTFHYAIPKPLVGRLEVGHLVRVPFGSRVLQGIVVALADTSPVVETRDIEDLLDPQPVLSPTQIKLARWISSYYLASLHTCLQQMLPPGLFRRAQLLVEWVESFFPPDGEEARGEEDRLELSATERALLRYLHERGPQAWRALGQAFDLPDWEEALEQLIWGGLVVKRWTLAPPAVRAKTTAVARLTVNGRKVELPLSGVGDAPKQIEVLRILTESGDPLFSPESLCRAANCSRGVLLALERKGWIAITSSRHLITAAQSAGETGRVPAEDLNRAPKQMAVLAYLQSQEGPMELSRLRSETDCSSSVLRALESKGAVRRWTEQPRILVRLNPIREALDTMLGETVDVPSIDLETLCIEEREVWRDPLAGREFVLTAPPRLTPEQEAAWHKIQRGLRDLFQGTSTDRSPRPTVYLLHGVTGSGKTELYLHALQETLAAGRQAIVLVPEIALTPQTIRRFGARFPNRIAVLHSGLSPGERYDSWRRIRAGRADVVIGPRSAVFAPLPRLGCIVLDEEHEMAYKQESTPRYHARDVALQRARLEQAVVILGSATPDLGTFYAALEGRLILLRLPRRVMGHRAKIEEQRARHAIEPARLRLRGAGPGYEDLRYLDLPPVEIVDLRAELKAGNRSIFSRALQSALAETLEYRQQAILFLNRRGAATFVLCRDCGLALTCRRCDVPLTYHTQSTAGCVPPTSHSGTLVCHHCGRQEKVPKRCPRCGGHRIRYFGAGTQRVEEALHELFPKVRSLRWDSDITGGASSHEVLLEQFVSHRADVLVGTQMVAKGLDLPLVTLVGVISADTALHLPDFRAGERTFQLLTQVAGRAGRSILGGRVIIQTYSPHHYAIQAAARHDYCSFYKQETAFRYEQGYPPFTRLARLVYRHRSEDRCMAEVQRLANLLRLEIRRQGAENVSLIGPAPCFFPRLQGRYRWQIVLRAPDPAVFLRPFELALGWQWDIDPVEVL